jgi:hypothetical protein
MMEKWKWYRIVAEDGQVWVDGARKKSYKFADIIPGNARGFICIVGGKATFISDEKMEEPR